MVANRVEVGVWCGLLLLAVFAVDCSGKAKRQAAGGDCFRTEECNFGLVCVEGICSTDLTGTVSMVAGPMMDPVSVDAGVGGGGAGGQAGMAGMAVGGGGNGGASRMDGGTMAGTGGMAGEATAGSAGQATADAGAM